jgi:hypothetical protein
MTVMTVMMNERTAAEIGHPHFGHWGHSTTLKNFRRKVFLAEKTKVNSITVFVNFSCTPFLNSALYLFFTSLLNGNTFFSRKRFFVGSVSS